MHQTSTDPARALLTAMFAAAIDSADPARIVARHLPDPPRGRVVVVGAGKAAAAMAQAVDRAWPDVPLSGVVVTRYGHDIPESAGGRIEVLQAGHPVPNEDSVLVARRIMAAVSGLAADDMVLAVMSGGGSALMALPADGLGLDDKIAVSRALLNSGLAIGDINRVRRRLSAIKGGRLAEAAAPARVVTLAISDVPGDDPLTIASGPTVPDPEAGVDLGHLARALGDRLPPGARSLLAPRTVRAAGLRADYRIIATPRMALKAAAEVARAAGVVPVILGDAIEGEAREAARVMAGIARSIRDHGDPAPAPAVLLSGGETTVTIGGGSPGRGGRNCEFLLSLAVALHGCVGIHALAADTDGIDGSEDAAGGLIGPDTLDRAASQGIDAAGMLAAHDSYSFFAALGDLIVTGPTRTNVNDFRAVLVL